MSDLRVVYVSGMQRSGTTLLGAALGQFPLVCNIGELWALWRPAFASGNLCGCGVALHECDFWRAVATRALGGDFEKEGMRLGELHRAALGSRRVPRAWLHATGSWPSQDLARYAAALGSHYRAVASVSGAEWIVDTSKMATDALVASTIPGIELFVVHLVRDPRGVAGSLRRHRRLPGAAGRAFDQHGSWSTSARWMLYNAFADTALRLRVGSGRYTTMRYEDLTTDPAAQLRSLAGWLDLPVDSVPVAGDPPMLFIDRVGHTVWGNLVGRRSGAVPVERDNGWHHELSRRDRLVVTATTAPLLLRYGYPVTARRDDRQR